MSVQRAWSEQRCLWSEQCDGEPPLSSGSLTHGGVSSRSPLLFYNETERERLPDSDVKDKASSLEMHQLHQSRNRTVFVLNARLATDLLFWFKSALDSTQTALRWFYSTKCVNRAFTHRVREQMYCTHTGLDCTGSLGTTREWLSTQGKTWDTFH